MKALPVNPPKPDVHQYIQRRTAAVRTETLFFDRTIQTLYATVRESAPLLFKLLMSCRMSALLGFLNYDFPLKKHISDPRQMLASMGIPGDEIYGPVADLNTFRRFFERRIRYWDCRPISPHPEDLASPADARLVTGSFERAGDLFIKEKFFRYEELIGPDKDQWLRAFKNGDYAILRLTPDKYHYNHVPVSGIVRDIYEINGTYHSCNPGAVVRSVTPYSKNRRVLTILDTDVENGSNMGLVAMVEIVALMIGRIVQCYSSQRYDAPEPVIPGMFLSRGQPKSLFRPGSSTTVLIFQKNRIRFSADILANGKRTDVQSRFTVGFGKPLVETELNVRETIGKAL